MMSIRSITTWHLIPVAQCLIIPYDAQPYSGVHPSLSEADLSCNSLVSKLNSLWGKE